MLYIVAAIPLKPVVKYYPKEAKYKTSQYPLKASARHTNKPIYALVHIHYT